MFGGKKHPSIKAGGLGWFPYPGLRKLTPQHKNQLLRV